ncbi:glycosyltransferase family 39 protein [Nocardia carnea]|uniref:glycosyltransferase family 39 protein n=1 Tax=Nocardia carnea TaxID=37328 RepID=UPI002455F420|nr:glycosyltransferase family 39 protein [Nocardia carnea]
MTTLTMLRPAPVPPVTPRRRVPWPKIGLVLLLVGTAAAYFWNLTANGFANSFYAAAVQSGAKSWEAFFFGSSDWSNAITVDKTPAALWPMALSARLFGFSSWSMLAPQVLLGVASVALLWATVRRSFGATAGLLSGLALAVTPVAALMFRFNNPDALLVLLMIAAVWALTRTVEDGRWRWLVLCGAFTGFGFLAKKLQVLLVLPALALVYLFAGPPRLGTRIAQLLAAGAAMVLAAGWWILIAQLWPAESRPYFGGSDSNSIIELTLGYNGLDRLSSSGGPGGGFGSDAGITRLFGASIGGQIAWLLPAALILLVAATVLRGNAARTDRQRATLLLFGGWGIVTGLVFSLMSGTFHQYYTVALAPAVAAVAGAGGVAVWRARDRLWVRLVIALSVALTAVTAWLLLGRTDDFVPWLRWVVLAVGTVATVVVAFPLSRALAVVAAPAVLFTGLAGPVAYTVDTLATPHSGSIVLAGPSTGMSGPGGMGGMGGGRPPGAEGGSSGDAGFPAGGAADDSGAAPGTGAAPGGATGGQPDGRAAAGGPGEGGGGPGSRASSAAVADLLTQDADSFRWAAATISSMNAADYQLASDTPVMSIGGFGGGDPSPTLEQFQQYVADGTIHYFIAGGHGGGPGSASDSEASKISEWVAANFTATEVDGVAVYDLTASA